MSRIGEIRQPTLTPALSQEERELHDPLAPNPLPLLGLLPVGFVRRVGADDPSTVSTIDTVENLSAANPTLANGDLNSAAGWGTVGDVAIGGGQAVLHEASTAQTELSQTFIVGQHDHALSFTVNGLSLHQIVGGQSRPGDAFEVALLDANTLAPLTATVGLSHADALLNI